MKKQYEKQAEEIIEPSAETLAAMEELMNLQGEEHDTLEDLWKSLEG